MIKKFILELSFDTHIILPFIKEKSKFAYWWNIYFFSVMNSSWLNIWNSQDIGRLQHLILWICNNQPLRIHFALPLIQKGRSFVQDQRRHCWKICPHPEPNLLNNIFLKFKQQLFLFKHSNTILQRYNLLEKMMVGNVPKVFSFINKPFYFCKKVLCVP